MYVQRGVSRLLKTRIVALGFGYNLLSRLGRSTVMFTCVSAIFEEGSFGFLAHPDIFEKKVARKDRD